MEAVVLINVETYNPDNGGIFWNKWSHSVILNRATERPQTEVEVTFCILGYYTKIILTEKVRLHLKEEYHKLINGINGKSFLKFHSFVCDKVEFVWVEHCMVLKWVMWVFCSKWWQR